VGIQSTLPEGKPDEGKVFLSMRKKSLSWMACRLMDGKAGNSQFLRKALGAGAVWGFRSNIKRNRLPFSLSDH
jgi:hypothetical protein